MASTIRIKRSTGVAAPGSLKTGELAYTYGTGTSANLGDRLFFGKGDDGGGNATSVVVIGGEYFANLVDHTPGTLTASSAIVVDGDSKIDVINVDNITINGNTISSTDTDGNIILDPNGTGNVNVNSSKIINVSTPTDTSDAATKGYVDNIVGGPSINLSIAGDTGTGSITLSDSDLTISGGTGLTTVSTDTEITISLDNTAVTPGSYGSATNVPVITVDQQGRITAASTATISTTLTTAAESGTGSVSLIDSSLEIAAGPGINTTASGNAITIEIDSAEFLANFESSISHDNLSGYVADEHIAHSGVSIIAGNGLTGGGDITASRTLNVIGGDGITANADEIEVTVDDSTIELSASDGSGAIQVKDGGITNAKLTNSSVTFGTTEVALGGTSTTLAGLTQVDIDNIRILDNTIASTSGVLYIDPTPIDDDGGSVVIRGDLTVQGTTTTINSTTVSINDKNLVLADSAADAAAADGAGITINGASATIEYNAAADDFVFNKGIQAPDFEGIYLGFDSDFNAKSTDDLSEGSNLYYTDERVDDRLSSLLLAGEGIDLAYDDGAGSLTVSAELATTANPGVANFDSDQMSVIAGLVSITEIDGGTF